MHNLISQIEAWLPYSSPGALDQGITLGLDLGRITVLLGQNASGKTATLEAVAYLLASHQDTQAQTLSLALTKTLRPKGNVPNKIGIRGRINNYEIASAYVTVTPLPFLYERNQIKSIIRENWGVISKEILSDLNRSIDILGSLPKDILRSRFLEGTERRGISEVFQKLLVELFGDELEIFYFGRFMPRLMEPGKLSSFRLRHLLRLPPILAYGIHNSSMVKSIIMSTPIDILVAKKREEYLPTIPGVLIFHPGFAYRYRLFERLYYIHIKEGLPNEKEATKLLREYLTWFDGFELVGKELHVKSTEGPRISIYDLSDGHRMAAILGLLYAISKPPIVFLIDTPEAFVHPDGISIIANFIAHLAIDGNQAIVATQSVEFLEALLENTAEIGVIEDVLVKRIKMEGTNVKIFGSWVGETARRSLKSLRVDLRR